MENEKLVQNQRKRDLVELPKEFEERITRIFKQIDKDDSGTLNKRELAIALEEMKFELSGEEFDRYFEKFDVDKDGVVTREEFKSVVLDWMRIEYAAASEFNENLRSEFRRFTEGTLHNLVNGTQLMQIFRNLSIYVPQDQFDAVYEEMLRSRQTKDGVDIETVMNYLQLKTEGMSPIAQQAIINLRQSSKLELSDIKGIF